MSDRATGRDSDKFMLRFPEGLRDRMKQAAEDNGRSMNAEIVIRLEASLLGESNASSTIDIIYPEALKRALNSKKPPTDRQMHGISAHYINVKIQEQEALREFFDYTANLLRDLNGEDYISLDPKLTADFIELDIKKRARAHGYDLVKRTESDEE
jgi:hypothetical protein